MNKFIVEVIDYMKQNHINFDSVSNTQIIISEEINIDALGRLYEWFKPSYNIRIEFIIDSGIQYAFAIYED